MKQAVVTELRAAAGRAALLDAARFGAYGVEPAAVVAPEDVAGAAAVLELCSREGWQVLPCGNGTRPATAWAALRRAAAGTQPVLLSTARLATVIEHEPADLVVGVAAGLPHAALRGALEQAKQELPLDPAMLTASTVGATIALGEVGPLCAGHGLPRDMVLGIEVVTGDGRILRFGGRVVKNVAGYDGVRLLTGSAGSLGLITSIFLRLRGLPREDRTLFFEYPAPEPAAAAVQAIRDAVHCDALELVSPRLARDLGLQPTWGLLARVRGGATAVEEAVARITAAAGASTPAPAGIWAELSRTEAAARRVCEVAAPPAELSDLLAAVPNAAQSHCAVHAANGVLRLWTERVAGSRQAGAATRNEDATGSALQGLRAAALDHGWTFRPAGERAQRDASAPRVDEIERRLQAQFDPAGILLPRLAVLA